MTRPQSESKRVPYSSRQRDAAQGRKGTRPRQGAAAGAATPKPEDPEQSRRFLETARQIGADRDGSAADGLMRKLAKQPRKPRADK